MPETIKKLIREIPDYPKPGINFKDITTLLSNGPGFKHCIELLAKRYKDERIDIVVGAEARGFIIGAPLAFALGAGFVPVRKPGKLPGDTHTVSYQLEYGSDSLEIHKDALIKDHRVLVVDDLLATGGTVAAVSELIKELGAEIVEAAFLIELDFLQGRDKLKGFDVFSLIHYE